MFRTRSWTLIVPVFSIACAGAPAGEPGRNAGTASPPLASAAPATPANQTSPSPSSASESAEGHAHHAPHGGALTEVGDEFAHLELVIDGATGAGRIYSLDGEAERAVRLKQPSIEIAVELSTGTVVQVFDAVTSPLTGESVGDASEFASRGPLPKGIRAARVVEISTRGTTFKQVPLNLTPGDH